MKDVKSFLEFLKGLISLLEWKILIPIFFFTTLLLLLRQISFMSIILEPMYKTIVWIWLLSAIGLAYNTLYSLFYFIRSKYEQHITQKAEELSRELIYREKELKVKHVIDDLTADEISLLKYVQSKAGVLWLPDTNAQVLGLIRASLIEKFSPDTDMSYYRGNKLRAVCSPYILTMFMKENKAIINRELTKLYGDIKISEKFSDYQVDDNFTLP